MDKIFKAWPNLIEALIGFYDDVNKEFTRDRELLNKHLAKVIEAAGKDIMDKLGFGVIEDDTKDK